MIDNENYSEELFSNWVEPFMLLNRGNCGPDDSVVTASNQTRIIKRGNRITLERLGTASTYYTALLYHGGAMASKKESVASISDAGIKSYNPTPIQLPTHNGYSSYAFTTYLRRNDLTNYNGTNFYIATYDSTNDVWTYASMGTFEKNGGIYSLTQNLSKTLPAIDTNENFIILCRTRSGYCVGDAWFNIYTIPKEAAT